MNFELPPLKSCKDWERLGYRVSERNCCMPSAVLRSCVLVDIFGRNRLLLFAGLKVPLKRLGFNKR